MIKYIERYPIPTIISIVIVMLLPNISTIPVSIMEARSFLTVRDMLDNGNWLLTTMNDLPRYEKPPLPQWISAVFAMLFGTSEFVLRLPAVLMIAVIGVYTFKISKQLTQRQDLAFWSALIVITSFYVIGIIIEAPWDIYTHGFMCIAIYYLLQSYTTKNISMLMYTALAIGASVLSKGPISIYALFIPFLIAYNLVYGFNKQHLIKSILVLLIGALLGGWWFLYVRYADAETFIEITSRETGRWANYNVKPLYYYWSFFTQSGLWTLPAFMGLWYWYLKDRVSQVKYYKFVLFWTLATLVLLSIVPEKKSRYLMPILIPLAYVTGNYISYVIARFTSFNTKERIPVILNFVLIGLVALAVPVVLWIKFESLRTPLFIGLSLPIIAIGLFLLTNLYRKHLKAVFYSAVAFKMLLFLCLSPFVKTLINSNPDYKRITQTDYNNLYVFDYAAPEVLWHYGDNIVEIPIAGLPKEQTFKAIVNNPELLQSESISNTYNVELLEQFDLNTMPSTSRQHRSRLVSYVYKFMVK